MNSALIGNHHHHQASSDCILSHDSFFSMFFSQQILSSLMRGAGGGRPDPMPQQHQQHQQEVHQQNEDTRRRLDQWYLQQVFNQYRQFAMQAAQQVAVPSGPVTPNGAIPHLRSGSANPASPHSLFMDLNLVNGNGGDPHSLAAAGLHPSIAAAAAVAASARPHPPATNGNMSNSVVPKSEKHYNTKHGNNHSGHHSASSRTRIRTSFDPELELPKLHKWFAENRHPSRSQVQDYVKELNALESRKGRKPLDVNNVVYWFKNARAAHKRAELKFVSNDSNQSLTNSHHHAFNAFAQNAEFFLNGVGNINNSPGKASSEASGGGKCNDDPLSIASRNGSHIDMDYYSFEDDEDGNDSHEETQTLDLSVRNNMMLSSSKRNSPDDDDINIKEENQDDSQDHTQNLEIILKERAFLGNDSNDMNHPVNDLMMSNHFRASQDNCGTGSECNSVEEDCSDDDQSSENAVANSLASHILARNAPSLLSMAVLNNNNSHSNSHSNSNNPESPEGRRTRRSRTFIDPMSEVGFLFEHIVSMC